jgi:predicted 3-demethylubiquinone-9 3-methyltransferase (glyoxalase superfamily)
VLVHFKIFGQHFVGLNGGPRFTHSEAVSFQIPCKDQAEIDKYWRLPARRELGPFRRVWI